ncbi:M28 family peptidase [bacterium]|nr:MAG: M28 family peptidase [bacterium]
MKARLSVVGFLLCFASCHPSPPIMESGLAGVRIESILDQHFVAERSSENLKYIAQFWRIAGGPGYDSCLSRIEAEVKSLTTASHPGDQIIGYEILEDPPTGPAWVPQDAVLSMESPEIRVLHSYASTPVMLCQNSFPCDLSAPVVYIPGGNSDEQYSQTDVRGRIVLCDAPAASAYRIAYDRGAAGLLSTHMPSYNKPQQHPDIIAESALPYDDQRKPFAINISPRIAAELKRLLISQPVDLRVQVKTSFVERPLRILAAEIRGNVKPDERIVLVAHLDHYKPGANDNASGSAALLEILRSIVTSIGDGTLIPPARTVTFLWVDEYRGTGSWMKRDPERVKNVLAAFVLDMVGGDPEKTGGSFRVERMPDPSTIWFRPPEQHSGWGTGTWDKRNLFGSFLNDYYLSIIAQRSNREGWKTTSNVWEGGSDHDPFLWRKIPAVLSWHFPDFAYHSSMDQVSNISAREMKNAGVSIGTAAFQLSMGSEDIARSILQTVSVASKKRLELLKAQLKDEIEETQSQGQQAFEAAKRQEKDILETWAAWYDQALESVLRVPAQTPSHAFEVEVQRERDELQKSVVTTKAIFGL